MYEVGSVINDPTLIRLFKSKVGEGKILIVNESNLTQIAEYVKGRTGIDNLEIFTKALEGKKEVIKNEKETGEETTNTTSETSTEPKKEEEIVAPVVTPQVVTPPVVTPQVVRPIVVTGVRPVVNTLVK